MASNEIQTEWDHRQATVNGVQLHCVETGAGPPVLLLHGFPEFWYSWRYQLPALAEAGFRAIAPDMRGYNESDKPPGIDPYRLTQLIEDAAELIEQTGVEKAAVVGHDWGGVIAWYLAARRPERVSRLVILNAPHPAAYRRELASLKQWLRSWYILFFQVPRLPELWLQSGDFAFLDQALRGKDVRPGAFTVQDVELYKEALRQPGALTAAINYYRAAVRYGYDAFRTRRPIRVPTLLIWGERDPFLGVGLTRDLERWVPGIRVERLPGAGHWVQNEEPETVNRLLVEFLRAGA